MFLCAQLLELRRHPRPHLHVFYRSKSLEDTIPGAEFWIVIIGNGNLRLRPPLAPTIHNYEITFTCGVAEAVIVKARNIYEIDSGGRVKKVSSKFDRLVTLKVEESQWCNQKIIKRLFLTKKKRCILIEPSFFSIFYKLSKSCKI